MRALACLLLLAGYFPVTDAVGCLMPPDVPNASLGDFQKLSEYPVGTKVSYSCNKGYVRQSLKGNTATCLQDSTWTIPTLICARKDCGLPGSPQDGSVTLDPDSKFGSHARYACNKGYNLLGRSARACQVDGWDYQVPSCEIVTCLEPPKIVNGEANYAGDSKYGASVTYRCSEGFLIGRNNIVCTETGDWSLPVPVCKEVKCDSPSVKNGKKTSGYGPSYVYRNSITFECDPGYKLNGSRIIVCEENSTWVPSPPTCGIELTTAVPSVTKTSVKWTGASSTPIPTAYRTSIKPLTDDAKVGASSTPILTAYKTSIKPLTGTIDPTSGNGDEGFQKNHTIVGVVVGVCAVLVIAGIVYIVMKKKKGKYIAANA
ncbi:membrane cofactor protein isoform X2 [Latimeria chalumnae]|uniref:membrane cofactor protein isoform X2 n=1 Tax=Latimeria chalumnae TaxID=7897 RepID=UPI00313BA49B